MHLITINANGQILSMCKCDQLVSDSIDVLEVQFVFDNAWAGMVKTAQFTQKNKETQAFDTYNVLIDDMGMACIPNEITDGVCIISVFGIVGGQRMTTAPLAVSVLKSGFIPDGSTPIPPTPDLYQQLLAEFQASSYELPTASAEMLGGVKVGQGLTVTPDGTLSATGGGTADSVAWENVTGKPETFPPAGHKHQAGDVEGLANVATSGNYEDLNNRPVIPAAYSLPTASAETLGGVKVGSGLSVADDGTLTSYVPYENRAHNSDFRHWIAQAGIGGAHGLQAYGGDRWILDSGTITGTENSNGNGYGNITLNGTIRQIVSDPEPVMTAFVGMISGTAQVSYANGELMITSAGGVLDWVLLLPGEWVDAPKYIPKGFLSELNECKYYYQRLKLSIWMNLCTGYVQSGGYFNATIPISPIRVEQPTLAVVKGTLYIGGSSNTPFGGEFRNVCVFGTTLCFQAVDTDFVQGTNTNLATRDPGAFVDVCEDLE